MDFHFQSSVALNLPSVCPSKLESQEETRDLCLLTSIQGPRFDTKMNPENPSLGSVLPVGSYRAAVAGGEVCTCMSGRHWPAQTLASGGPGLGICL